MPRLSTEQKASRREGIGSSDVAELLGISPYEGASPVRLWAEKTGRLPPDDDEETTAQAVGHALEGALVTLYERESGRKVHVSGEYVESVTDAEHPWMRANLDGRIEGAPIALEIKAVGIGMARDWDILADDGIPAYVRVQVAWQMRVAKLEEVHVVALVAGPSGFRVFYVKRDPELEALIVAAAERFWRGVTENECPPLDASKATIEYLESLYPSPPVDVEVRATEVIAHLLDAHVDAGRVESDAKEARAILGARIRAAMGELGATVTWSATARATWKADKNGQRSLRVVTAGEARKLEVRRPKANAQRMPKVETFVMPPPPAYEDVRPDDATRPGLEPVVLDEELF